MNQYQFQQIARRMEQRYGKMKKNEEDRHAMLLFPMESNLLKIYRRNRDANSRRLWEAILLALHEIEGRIDGDQKNTGSYENKENRMLKEALLKSFDPFTNEEIKMVLEIDRKMDLNDKNVLVDYYKEPVICMLRIKDSVEVWLKRNGCNGYFAFLESWMGQKIPNDDNMNYSIYVSDRA